MSRFYVGAERRDAFSGAYNPFENPAVPLASVGLENVFGQNNSDAGEPVTQENAFAIPTVFRCIALLAGLGGSLPIEVWKFPGRKLVTPSVPTLNPDNPTTTYTQMELWELVIAHIAGWGNAYVKKVRSDPKGSPTDLQPIYPGRVKVDFVDGNKMFIVNNGAGKDPTPYTTFEVMHVPGFGYDGVTGLSPIDLARQAIGTAKAGDKLAARFLARGSQLSGVLQVKAPLESQEQADAIKRKWTLKNAGVAHAGDITVLDAETTFNPLTIPPDAMQFLQSRRWQTTEIARMFGIPPHLVGDVEKSTSWGTGIEQQNTAFVAYTLNGGYISRIEQRVTREVVATRGQRARFNIDDLLRGDLAERCVAYASAIQWGWITRNEVRRKENMEPITGLDAPLTPLNMQAGNNQTEKLDPNVTPLAPQGGAHPGSGAQQSEHEDNE